MINVLSFGPVADRIQMRETQGEFTQSMIMYDFIAHIGTPHP